MDKNIIKFNYKNTMKGYYQIMMLIVVATFLSCENQPNQFDDFGITTAWFPYQTPARTIILGNYDVGFNDNDNDFKFEIGAKLSGLYENKIDRNYYYEIDESLLDTIANVEALPSAYYTIETPNPVTIPAGRMDGRITVKLNDNFFNDPKSFYPKKDSVNYVIPLVMNKIERIDSILTGLRADGVTNPHRLIEDDWEIKPKDYTLFGIKFINKYHGKYFKRGADKVLSSTLDTTVVYSAEFVENDLVRDVVISGRNNVIIEENIVRRGGLQSPGTVAIELAFDENENCTISSPDGAYNVSGTGTFVKEGGEWGGEKRDAIFINYTYDDPVNNNENHVVIDTLVIRNRGVVFESFPIVIKE